ncbi:MAG: hypothetical protein ACTHK7_19575 [Aureliella sp.]
MAFPTHLLAPVGGEIYCHVFENARTGLVRDLYWSVTVDFAPIIYAHERFCCNAMVEWFRIKGRDFPFVEPFKLSLPADDPIAESSFYMTEHAQANSTTLRLACVDSARFHAELEMVVDFHGYTGDDAEPAMRVAATTELQFSGLIVVLGNLDPSPSSPEEVVALASQFADLSGYDPPLNQGFRYLFRPSVR